MGYLKNRRNAFSYAFKGILSFFKEPHARIHLSILFIVIALGLFLDIQKMEWIAVIFASALVISLEMINSALERALDRIHPEKNELIGLAKDISAGAVLLSALAAFAVGVLIFLPYFQKMLDTYLS